MTSTVVRRSAPASPGLAYVGQRELGVQTRDAHLDHARDTTRVDRAVAMRQSGAVTTYRERLTAPLSWWITVVAFGLVWGWIMLVATNRPDRHRRRRARHRGRRRAWSGATARSSSSPDPTGLRVGSGPPPPRPHRRRRGARPARLPRAARSAGRRTGLAAHASLHRGRGAGRGGRSVRPDAVLARLEPTPGGSRRGAGPDWRPSRRAHRRTERPTVAKKKKSEPVKSPKGVPGGKRAWKLMDRGATVGAGLLARKVSVPHVADRHPAQAAGGHEPSRQRRPRGRGCGPWSAARSSS